MKIFQVVSLLGTGGVERQVLCLADGMIDLGHNVRIIVLRESSSSTVFTTRAKIESLCMTKSPWGIVRAAWKARKLIQAFEPDLVHSHMFHACIFTRLLRLFVKIPYLVCTPHLAFTPLNVQEGSKKHIFAYRLTDWLTDLTTNVGTQATESFIASGATPAKRITTVYNGYDTERFRPDLEKRSRLRTQFGLNADVFLWLAAGRLSEQKDYRNMLAAFLIVTKANHKAALYIAGNGPLEQEYRDLIASMNLNGKAKLLGVRADIPDLMTAADGYVLSSAWEALPMVIGEAMASGLPVVATECSGVHELLGECGWVVPPKNSIALADAMIDVANMPSDQRSTFGLAARERICNHFSLEGKCAEWINLYKGRVGKH